MSYMIRMKMKGGGRMKYYRDTMSGFVVPFTTLAAAEQTANGYRQDSDSPFTDVEVVEYDETIDQK